MAYIQFLIDANSQYRTVVTSYCDESEVYSKVSDVVDYYYGILRANVEVTIYTENLEHCDIITYNK